MKDSALKYMQEAGYSPQLVDHIEMQLPDLIQETLKRIKYSPFDNNNSVVDYDGGPKSRLIGYLTTLALGRSLHTLNVGQCMKTSPQYLASIKAIVYSDKTMNDEDQSPIVVRGHELPRKQMPLYLENGEHELAYVYPLFDWSKLQILTACVDIGLIETEEK